MGWNRRKNLQLQLQKQKQAGAQLYSGLTKRYETGLMLISTFPGYEVGRRSHATAHT
jgi:hypothetical protein